MEWQKAGCVEEKEGKDRSGGWSWRWRQDGEWRRELEMERTHRLEGRKAAEAAAEFSAWKLQKQQLEGKIRFEAPRNVQAVLPQDLSTSAPQHLRRIGKGMREWPRSVKRY